MFTRSVIHDHGFQDMNPKNRIYIEVLRKPTSTFYCLSC